MEPTTTTEAPQRYQLPSGLIVELQLPDLWAIVSQAGRIPNPITMAVLDLLIRDDAYAPDGGGGGTVYLRKREEVLGMLAIASLCLVSPRLVFGRTAGPGEINALPFADLEVLYFSWFRRGAAPAAPPLPGPADAAGAPVAAPAGGGLPPAAE